MFRPSLEALEVRALLSVSSVLNGTVLSLTGDTAPHQVLIRASAAGAGAVDILADGQTQTYTGLTQVNFTAYHGATTFTNRVATLPGTITLGDDKATVYTIAPKSTVITGNGNDILQVTGGNSIITAGNGTDNVYGGPGDTITLGSGQDIVYDILPGTQSIAVAAHTAVDHLFVGPQSTLMGALAQDHVAQFFTAAPQGSGTLVQSGSTLYFAANNAGDTAYFFGTSQLLIAEYSLNDGTGFHLAFFTGVNQIAAFGGTGNDNFINSSTVDDAMYGAGGSNFLVGGFGSLDLEKSGGAAATGSTAIGRSAVYNDLNGSGLTNTTNTLIFAGGAQATNVARTNSPTDVVLGANRLVSLYPDLVLATFLPPFVPA